MEKSFFPIVWPPRAFLASLGQPIEIVAAGLVHNVYGSGDFGDGKEGLTQKRQQYIRSILGPRVETLLSRFKTFHWGKDFLPHIHASLETMSQLDQSVVLILLADNLEHNSIYGSCYYLPEERSFYHPPNQHLLIEMANILGFPVLARQLATVQSQNAGIIIPKEFLSTQERGFLIPPSLKKRWLVRAYEFAKKGYYGIQHRVALPIQFLRRVGQKVRRRIGSLGMVRTWKKFVTE